MSANIWKTGTNNAFSTTLDGSITDSDVTITLTSITGLQAPGVIVLDRVDANDVATPTSREYISFTSIDGLDIKGCTRELGGSTAQAHNSSAVVEEAWSITHWNDFIDTFRVAHDADGKIVSSSLVTLSQIRTDTLLNVSGASLVGFSYPLRPVWQISGTVSLATTSVGKPLALTEPGNWEFFSAVVRTPVSGASLLLDINKNFTSIFEAGTRPLFPQGGTFVSTASINTKTYIGGDIFTVDIDGGGGTAEDLTIIGRGMKVV